MKISENFRRVMQIIPVILALLFTFLIIREYKTDRQKEEFVPVYTYSNHGTVHYNVFLKPNFLYSQSSIEEGNIYITELVNDIEATFEYKFIGERPADIEGNYEIVAVVEGHMNIAEDDDNANQSESTGKTIWEKSIVIIPKTNFVTNESVHTITRNVSLNYHEYNDLSKEIIELTKLSIPTRLSVFMNVNTQVNTDKGIIEEKFTQSLIIPFGGSSFEIKKNEIGEKTDSLDDSKMNVIPVNIKNIYIYGICLILIVFTFIFITFFTRGATTDEHIMELNILFKKYNSRLVAVSSVITGNNDKIFKVRSMDDLVKLADEVGRPIIYRFSENPLEIFQFYIFSDSWIYEFNLIEKMSEKRKETRSGEKEEKANNAGKLKTQINYKSRVRPDSLDDDDTNVI